MSWDKFGLENICEIINGGSWKHEEYVSQGVKVIKVSNLVNDGIDESNMSFLPYDALSVYEKNILKSYDLVVTTVGSHPQLIASAAGRGFVISPEYDGTLLNQNSVCIRTKDENVLHNRFLGYIGRSDDFRHFIQQTGRGAANQMRIPIGNIKLYSLSLPPLQTQIRVANILSKYDDLIENNLKRIKLLEETAQNIYKEWFVNFRFPNYEHTEFDVQSGLPFGWEKKTIDAFGDVITGKTPSTANSNFYGGNVPFVKTPDMHDAPYALSTSIYLSNEGAESQNNKFLPKNSVMVSCIGTAGVVALTSESCQTNQQINSVKFDEEFKSFYFYGFARGLRTLLEGLGSNGATMVNVNKSKFEKIELVVPNDEVLKKHYSLVKVIFDQILILQEHNQKLMEARDILLPRLMNRTIEV
jgi:type I restriction enzyme S subunit